MFLKQSLIAIMVISPVSMAWAVPTTEEEAERLTGVFQTYFGSKEGVVSVTRQPESYELKIDATPLLAQVPVENGEISVSTLTYQLIDNGDDTWQVSEDQTLTWTVNIPDMFEQKGSAKLESSGTWDESLMTFSEQKSVITDYVIDSTQYAPEIPEVEGVPKPTEKPQLLSRDHQRTARMEMTLTGVAAEAGGVDQVIDFTAEGLEQSQKIMMEPGQPPLAIKVTSPGYDGTAKITGARTEGNLSLLAWFVAHPSEELIKGSQEELREKLTSATPLWEELSVDATMRDIKIGSPIGEFGLASAKVMVGMSGATADGHLQEQLAISGLTYPEDILPPSLAPIVPQEVTFDFTASEFDLAAPAKMLIESFDLNAEDPLGKLDPDQLLTAFLPNGTANLKFAPSQIKGADYQIDYNADIAVGPATLPVGSALITATGLDKVEAALTSAPDKNLIGDPLMMLRMARAMSKRGDNGENVWDIQMPESGAITVNGQPVGPGPSKAP